MKITVQNKNNCFEGLKKQKRIKMCDDSNIEVGR